MTAPDRRRLEAIVADRKRAAKACIESRGDPCDRRRLWNGGNHAPLGLSKPSVWRWQERFMREGVAGLLRDKTRKPSKPPIADETVRRVLDLTLAAPPGETTHWTSQMMATRSG